MNWVAWKMLNGDIAKYLGAVFGVFSLGGLVFKDTCQFLTIPSRRT